MLEFNLSSETRRVGDILNNSKSANEYANGKTIKMMKKEEK